MEFDPGQVAYLCKNYSCNIFKSILIHNRTNEREGEEERKKIGSITLSRDLIYCYFEVNGSCRSNRYRVTRLYTHADFIDFLGVRACVRARVYAWMRACIVCLRTRVCILNPCTLGKSRNTGVCFSCTCPWRISHEKDPKKNVIA